MMKLRLKQKFKLSKVFYGLILMKIVGIIFTLELEREKFGKKYSTILMRVWKKTLFTPDSILRTLKNGSRSQKSLQELQL